MPVDIGEAFRNFGRDVHDAILDPVKTRLAALQMQDEHEADKKKKTAQEQLASQMTEQERMLYEAEGFDAVMSVRKLALERSKAASRGKGDGRYGVGSDIATMMTNKQLQILGDASNEVLEAYQSKDPEKIKSAQEKYNKIYDGVDKMKNFGEQFNGKMKNALLADWYTRGEDGMAKLTPERVNAIAQTVVSTLGNSGFMDQDILDEIENTKAAYGVDGVDLSGIPSKKDVTNFAFMSVANGDMSMDIMGRILDTDDSNELAEIANSKEAPKPIRVFAGARLKQMKAYQNIDSAFDQKLEQASEKDLINMTEKTHYGDSVLGKTLEGKAKKEREKRQKKAAMDRISGQNSIVNGMSAKDKDDIRGYLNSLNK